MATCFPESQSRSGRSGGVGLEPGEVEPFCSLQPVPPPPPLSLPVAAHPVHRLFVLRVQLRLRGGEEAGCARRPWGKLQSLFGEPWENTWKEGEHRYHGPALLLSFLKRGGKNQ